MGFPKLYTPFENGIGITKLSHEFIILNFLVDQTSGIMGEFVIWDYG